MEATRSKAFCLPMAVTNRHVAVIALIQAIGGNWGL
ncbi:hypothetical protein M529_12390 [Sphingobium ummariense RL-3]|uniref:Uncharacterized protein n=1 Tax=Sphingobium ummariense RL-3 TaxID=1346791 RepID=T0J1M8_9SPHN|nr:hypothetical protein M529_12390 [Sphingobium ummariense RL-3]